jgi:translation initiation factor IF-1
MTKEEGSIILKDGIIIENLSNNKFKVELKNGHKIIAYVCGRMSKKNKIQVIKGDSVRLEISPYDPVRGRIVYRYK